MRNVNVLTVLLVLIMGAPVFAAVSSIGGKWNVQAVLTATSVPNDHVKEGHLKQETWSIDQQGETATLTTPNGAISGRFVAQTTEFPQGAWFFEVMVPNMMNLPNLGAKFEVVIVERSVNVLSGGTTVTYMGNNSFGGPWYPIGIESWRFDGNRIP